MHAYARQRAGSLAQRMRTWRAISTALLSVFSGLACAWIVSMMHLHGMRERSEERAWEEERAAELELPNYVFAMSRR